MNGAAPGQELDWGYRPEAWPLRELRRQFRDLQTHFPGTRAAKFAAFNLATRHLGLFADPEFRLLAKLPPLELALDIGGNWGQSVVALQRYARARRIVTVEPNPLLAEHLRRQFAGVGHVSVVEKGLGLAQGQHQIHVPRYRGYVYDGIASLDRDAATQWLHAGRIARFSERHLSVDSFTVQVDRLDALALAPDLIKIDVQGFEAQVIGGGLQTIAAHKPLLIIERPDEQVVAILGKLGLSPFGWNGTRLVEGDLTRKNAMFLADRHVPLLT